MLKKYKCHKTVEAAKIQAVVKGDPHSFLIPVEGKAIEVSGEYLAKHKPQVAGYYVRYEDGYESFSPAPAFEGGYSELDENLVEPKKDDVDPISGKAKYATFDDYLAAVRKFDRESLLAELKAVVNL